MEFFLALLPAIIKGAGSAISALAAPDPQQGLVGFNRQDVEAAQHEAQGAARDHLAATREFASRDVTIPGFDVSGIVGDINVPGLSPGLGLGISQGTADIIGQSQSLPGIRFPEGMGAGSGTGSGSGGVGGTGREGDGGVTTTFNQFPNDPRPPIIDAPGATDPRDSIGTTPRGGGDGDRGVRGGMDPGFPGGDPHDFDHFGDPRTHPDDRRGSVSAGVSFASAEETEQALDDIAHLLSLVDRYGQGGAV